MTRYRRKLMRELGREMAWFIPTLFGLALFGVCSIAAFSAA